jgi:Pyruvate/2-oxoacid:ferredoxin oxidoreductase delta subunit
MKRNIVKIDEEKCNGCGQCVTACAEGAIQIIDGKAKLVSEVYCDGLGACLGECPQDAITIEQREAAAFDEAATHEHLENQQPKTVRDPSRENCPPPAPISPSAQTVLGQNGTVAGILTTTVQDPLPHGRGYDNTIQSGKHHNQEEKLSSGCPGTMARTFERPASKEVCENTCVMGEAAAPAVGRPSELGHWPVQLKLVSPAAPYLQGADLLLVADCVPFAYNDFHATFLKGKSVVVGCPKLDDASYYVDKLADILEQAKPASLTVIHMEVPCCSGLSRIAEAAVDKTGSAVPVRDVTISLDGKIIE